MVAIPIRKIIQPASRRLEVNWQNPLSRGLFDAVVFNQGIPRNIAAPFSGITRTSSPTYSITAQGPAGYATGGSSFDLADRSVSIAAGNLTFRVIFMPVTWPAAFCAFVDKGTANREMSFFSDTSGNLDFIGIGTISQAVSISTAMAAGSVWDFVTTRTGSTVTFYVNGISKGTATNSSTSKNTQPTSLGRNTSGGGVNANARYLLMQSWARALSQPEILQLYADPYCWTTNVDDQIMMAAIQTGGAAFVPAWATPSNFGQGFPT